MLFRSENLQLVYRKADGSLGVTNGEVADPKMSVVPEKKPEKEEPPVEEPVETPGEEVPPPGLEELPEILDPEVVLPEPEELPQDIQTPETEEVTEENNAVQPEPVEPADTAA